MDFIFGVTTISNGGSGEVNFIAHMKNIIFHNAQWNSNGCFLKAWSKCLHEWLFNLVCIRSITQWLITGPYAGINDGGVSSSVGGGGGGRGGGWGGGGFGGGCLLVWQTAVADPGLEIRGAYFFRISNCTPSLESFPEATMEVYTCILIGFRFAPPPPWSFFLKPLYKSIPAVSGGVERHPRHPLRTGLMISVFQEIHVYTK